MNQKVILFLIVLLIFIFTYALTADIIECIKLQKIKCFSIVIDAVGLFFSIKNAMALGKKINSESEN